MKRLNIVYSFIITTVLLSGCQAGIVYEEVPESVYNNVELGSGYCNVSARQIFKSQIYAENWKRWVDEYMGVSNVGSSYQGGKDYTNTTTAAITILGTPLAPGATVKVKNTITKVDDATAPDGKRYVLNIFANSWAQFSSQNSTYYFVSSKFSGNFKLVDKDGKVVTTDKSPYIKLPVNQSEIVLSMILADGNGGCDVNPLDGAPVLGAPGDFTQPRKYLVVNNTRRPDGKPAAQRLYEIKLQLLP